MVIFPDPRSTTAWVNAGSRLSGSSGRETFKFATFGFVDKSTIAPSSSLLSNIGRRRFLWLVLNYFEEKAVSLQAF